MERPHRPLLKSNHTTRAPHHVPYFSLFISKNTKLQNDYFVSFPIFNVLVRELSPEILKEMSLDMSISPITANHKQIKMLVKIIVCCILMGFAYRLYFSTYVEIPPVIMLDDDDNTSSSPSIANFTLSGQAPSTNDTYDSIYLYLSFLHLQALIIQSHHFIHYFSPYYIFFFSQKPCFNLFSAYAKVLLINSRKANIHKSHYNSYFCPSLD